MVAQPPTPETADWWDQVVGGDQRPCPPPSTPLDPVDPEPWLSRPCGTHAQQQRDKALAEPVVPDVAIVNPGEGGEADETLQKVEVKLPKPPKVLGGKPIAADDPKFKKWLERKSREATLWASGQHPRQIAAVRTTEVLQRNWSRQYKECPRWGHMAKRIVKAEQSGQDWPEGYRKLEDKLYYNGKLCFPECLEVEYAVAVHESAAHVRVQRLAKELYRRAHVSSAQQVAKTVVQHCQECQANAWPNQPRQGEMGPQPVPDRPFDSIATDIFKLGMVDDPVEGKVDGVLLTTCRLTGHVSAFPIAEKGCGAEKAEKLMARRAFWGSFGPPKVISSDRGPQYAAKVAKTMCAQLGIAKTEGQAHRSQSNGKAESAGKVLIDEIRTALTSNKGKSPLSWVDVLPRALYWHHQRVDPDTGYSIHEKVFGRQGGYPGPKISVVGEDQDMVEFCEKMEAMDETRGAVETAQAKMKAKYDQGRKPDGKSHHYHAKQRVWVLRPRKKPVSNAVKLDTVWCGPYEVVRRTGTRSYDVNVQGSVRNFHIDKMKPYYPDLLGRDVPVAWTTEAPVAEDDDDNYDVEKVVKERCNPDGTKSYLVKWKGYKGKT